MVRTRDRSQETGVGWLARACGAACAVLLLATPVSAQTFYPDDPLKAEPEPYPTFEPQIRALSEILELASNTVGGPGERHPDVGVIEAGGVNTLGEVLDGPWFVNRHATRPLTHDELAEGPGTDNAPSDEGNWQILTIKPFGSRPGMLIADQRARIYLLLFDSPDSPELATGAQHVASRIMHAVGYHVPETHVISFAREKLVLAEGANIISSADNKRTLTEVDVDKFLRGVARTALGRHRAVALYASPSEWSGLLGPYQVYTTRSDDANDIVPHEHRRDLRGLYVIASWINHAAFRAVTTLDVLFEERAVPPHIRHYIVDFWSSLGSGINGRKRAWEGNDSMFDRDAAFRNIIGFGIWSPSWMGATYPKLPAAGRFEAATFKPDRWTPLERLAPFENRLPDDEFWGAKQVMAFRDDDVETLVSTGAYTDPEAAEWITRTLIARRDKIGRHYFAKMLPLDNFRVENGRVQFDDLAERYGVTEIARTYTARWLRLLNETGALVQVQGANSFDLPTRVDTAAAGSYYAVRVEAAGEDAARHVIVYLRTVAGGNHEVVGIERGWPGKVLADPSREIDTGVSRFASLDPEQQKLYEPFAIRDADARGRTMTPEEHFNSQTISERTTYDAVTHALMSSALTDEEGNELGTAFDLVAGIERVAGQYYGRGGDQQFRLYVDLRPDAVETLHRSTQFFEGHENTVYHVGYPYSFRQEGDVPNMQVSVAEDGLKADIDVDYRSSKSPGALFNGHLTSANSDVRAGDNVDRHNGRWSGLVAWWQDVFGNMPGGQQGPQDIFAAATEVPTPLPDNRPPGATIDRPEDAVQEFLTDWLVRRDVDEAISFMSDRAFACVNTDDDARYEALGADGARTALRETMRLAVDEMGERHNLTEAVDAVPPLTSDRVVIDHLYDGEFAMAELSPDEAAQYLCGAEEGQASGESYHGVIFRFKHPDGAAHGLLWTQEDGERTLVSYQIFEI